MIYDVNLCEEHNDQHFSKFFGMSVRYTGCISLYI